MWQSWRVCMGLGLWVALAMSCGDDGDDGSGGSAGTGSGGDGFLGSCDTRTAGDASVLGQCREWSGSAGADLAVSCGGIGGSFSPTTRCPTDDRVGSCELDPVLGVTATYFYYAPTWAEADAQSHCDALGGTFATT